MPSSPREKTSVAAPSCGEPEPLWPAGAQLGEGLCWSPQQQAIYWVDIFGQRLMRLHPGSGQRRQWDFDETISAVAERSTRPGLVVALRHRIALFDPDTATLHTLHEVETDLPDNRFNDGKCDAQGRFWVGSMDTGCTAPTGSLYRVGSEGEATSIACAWAAQFPVTNGPAWSPDGRTMWVNDTARNFIHRCRFDPIDGTVSEPAVWLRFAKGDGYPDGMTTDRDGRLWIAHWGGGCVTCHAPDDGRELARIELPASNITNVSFGGADLRSLFVTSAAAELSDEQRAAQPLAGALFVVPTDASGIVPHRFAG
ncbi:SMP-30/gluconolactonase/LRE family protein [Piscinibacter sp.]|uniref:SMP-30/gluconolactonase/LRE family protein n=1 Tax=Piscinibacter sp. TaxID=1903157 RepID=UPI002BDCE902|nr:SMP-30/gluconolactonase/LRE family protein [Albitalea sp.]HUG22004.1 SMP-30/gluconolactonase/LRE family protein [Albitalea sp.]